MADEKVTAGSAEKKPKKIGFKKTGGSVKKSTTKKPSTAATVKKTPASQAGNVEKKVVRAAKFEHGMTLEEFEKAQLEAEKAADRQSAVKRKKKAEQKSSQSAPGDKSEQKSDQSAVKKSAPDGKAEQKSEKKKSGGPPPAPNAPNQRYATFTHEEARNKKNANTTIPFETYQATVRKLRDAISRSIKVSGKPNVNDVWTLHLNVGYMFMDCPKEWEYVRKASNTVKTICQTFVDEDPKYSEIFERILLIEARSHIVDSGLLYLEKNREPDKRFYAPRRECFIRHGIIQGLQDLVDGKLDLMTLSVPPGVGKSTLEVFFLSLVGGWWPNEFNLSSAHSSILTRSLYDGINEILTDTVEYTWHEIFPKVMVEGTNAKDTTINLDRMGRFKTWTMRSIDGSLTGATRCSQLLTADDLVSGIEEALNKNRLETLWTKVVNDLRSRKLDGCRELFIATRWSVHDPIGKLMQRYEGDPRVLFISVPALDDNGESNFDFPYNGFSTQYFLDQQAVMDQISFDCLYMQKPVEREGLLYFASELRRFYMEQSQIPDKGDICEVLPDREPDAIWGVCDTKDKGTDFNAHIMAYQYGEDYYIVDCVFDDSSDYDYLDRKNTDLILKHNPHRDRFESNQAGGRIAHQVEKNIAGKSRTVIDTKYTVANKETKILVNSDWVKRHCLFLAPALYGTKTDYGRFMANVTSYTVRAKVPHDDGPDVLAMLAEFVQHPMAGKAVAIQNPLWG